MKEKFDVIVVGAGTAGCTLAKKLTEAGLSTALVDSKPKGEIGYPWEVTVEHDVFGRITMKAPAANMLLETPTLYRFYAADRENHVQIGGGTGKGFPIRHKVFNQYLLEQTLKAGVVFFPQHKVKGFLFGSDDNPEGVTGTKTGPFHRNFSLYAPLVADASGITSVLRKDTPERFGIKRKVRIQDYAFGWNEVRKPDTSGWEQIQDEFDIKPGMSYTFLGKQHAYETIHMREDGTVSFIFGAALQENPKIHPHYIGRYFEERPYLGKRVHAGGQPIPIRRALDTMVGDGFLCLGDAACQVIPTMGSGVASSIHAADIAARTITGAFNDGNLRVKRLWEYNVKYQRKRGAVLASYDIIRRLLQSLSEENINEVFKVGLLKDENFLNTYTSNTIRYNIWEILENMRKFFGHIQMIPLGIHFLQALKDSQRAMELYKNYPEKTNNEEFTKWVKETDNLFSKYRTFRKGGREIYF